MAEMQIHRFMPSKSARTPYLCSLSAASRISQSPEEFNIALQLTSNALVKRSYQGKSDDTCYGRMDDCGLRQLKAGTPRRGKPGEPKNKHHHARQQRQQIPVPNPAK